METNGRIRISNSYPSNSYTITTTVPLYDSRSVNSYHQINRRPTTNYRPYVTKYNNYKNIGGEGLYLRDLYYEDYYKFSDAAGQSLTSKLSSTVDIAKYLPSSKPVRAGLFLFDSVGSISSCMSTQQDYLDSHGIFTAENNTIANNYCTSLSMESVIPLTFTPNQERERLHRLDYLQGLSPEQLYNFNSKDVGVIDYLTTNIYRYVNGPLYTTIGTIYGVNDYKNIIFRPVGNLLTTGLNSMYQDQIITVDDYGILDDDYSILNYDVVLLDDDKRSTLINVDKDGHFSLTNAIDLNIQLLPSQYLFLDPTISNINESIKFDGKVRYSNFTFGWDPFLSSSNDYSALGNFTVSYRNFSYDFNIFQKRRYFSISTSYDGESTSYGASGNPLCLFDRDVTIKVNSSEISSSSELHWNIRDGWYRSIDIDDDFLDIHIHAKGRRTSAAVENAKTEYEKQYMTKFYCVTGIPPEIANKSGELTDRDIAFCEETNESWCRINNVTEEEREYYFSNNSEATQDEIQAFLMKKKSERTPQQEQQLNAEIESQRTDYVNHTGIYSDANLVIRKNEKTYQYCGFSPNSLNFGEGKKSRYLRMIEIRFNETLFEYWCEVNGVTEAEIEQYFTPDDSTATDGGTSDGNGGQTSDGTGGQTSDGTGGQTSDGTDGQTSDGTGDQTSDGNGGKAKSEKEKEFEAFANGKAKGRSEKDNNALVTKLHSEEEDALGKKGKYSRTEIIKYANYKLLLYNFSQENLLNTLSSSALTVGASTIAYIDRDIAIIKEKGLVYCFLNKTKQVVVTSAQIFFTQTITNHAVTTIGLCEFADNWEDSFLNNTIAPNIYNGISSTISLISVLSSGNYHKMNTGDKFKLFGENLIRINSSNIVKYAGAKIGIETASLVPYTGKSLLTKVFGESITTKVLPVMPFVQSTGIMLAFRFLNYLINKDRCNIDIAEVDKQVKIIKKEEKTSTCIKMFDDSSVSDIEKELVMKNMVNEGLILPKAPTQFNVKF